MTEAKRIAISVPEDMNKKKKSSRLNTLKKLKMNCSRN